MGTSNYSDDAYQSRINYHQRTNTDPFKHDADVRAGKVAAGPSPKLDPKQPNTRGEFVRESLDSDVHPNSRAIAVLFDETGSMRKIPRLFLEKLPNLMAGLTKKQYVEDPQILLGAIGDARNHEAAPLQLGQFEAGNEMDEALSLIFLEGDGGGQGMETYELAMYYMARHTVLDCFRKRGQKGYLFIIGDEAFFPTVSKLNVKTVIGDDIEADIPTEQIYEELTKKFEVYWLRPEGAQHSQDSFVLDKVQPLLGERMISLKDPADVCEMIIGRIGLNEGFTLDDVQDNLRGIGSTDATINRVTESLARYAPAAGTMQASASGLSSRGTDDVTRL